MLARLALLCAGLLVSTAVPVAVCAQPPPGALHHELSIKIDPAVHHLEAEDRVRLPPGLGRRFSFLLHRGLEPEAVGNGVDIRPSAEPAGVEGARRFDVVLDAQLDQLVLRYAGSIYNPVESKGPEVARGFGETSGTIEDAGVFLAGYSFWYPRIGDSLLTFSLEVELPPGWDAVSQGRRDRHLRGEHRTDLGWSCAKPQEEIFLVAGRFTEFVRDRDGVKAMVFLHQPEAELAEKYLEATAAYVPMYEQLIGPYPYDKFALVENFWESGLGMPSFTLLGSRVLRLPFLVRTSYPHEILHNWWGNSVYPDLDGGNWTEGLTAYLADHLDAEQRGRGAEYRRGALQKYADYVSAARDFSLSEFHSRHSSSSEAVGYGKSAMFFHMLRIALGDDAFRAGLAEFYATNAFTRAGYSELRTSFEKASGVALASEFKQWIQLAGAPRLAVSDAEAVRVDGDEGHWEITATIDQLQPGAAYSLRVPLAVTVEGRAGAWQSLLAVSAKHQEVRLSVPARPLRMDVDPEFDVFRRLDRAEIPPALSAALGARRMLLVVPAVLESEMAAAYRRFAAALGNSGPDGFEVVEDTALEQLPNDVAVVVLGWENAFSPVAVAALSAHPVDIGESAVKLGSQELPRGDHAFVFATRNPRASDHPLVLVAADSPAALPGLARKLPHYHKYSYLAFSGDEPSNVAKGAWPVSDSPMTVFFGAGAGAGAGPGSEKRTPQPAMARLAARAPLASLAPVFSAEAMKKTVEFLASPDLAGRGLGSEGLDRAGEFIAEAFRRAGLSPGGDSRDSYFQSWQDVEVAAAADALGSEGQGSRLRNVIGILEGKADGAGSPVRRRSVVIAAHYDHLGHGWPDVHQGDLGRIHPGADDNASGVAVLLELARVLGERRDRLNTIVMVAFTGEEAGRRGSRHYVSNYRRYAAADAIAMINLDSVGRLGRNKLMVLGAGSAREWPHVFRGAGYVTGTDIEVVTSSDADGSDHVSFEQAGVAAVQLFSGAHADYHRPSDTAERIDAAGMAKVAAVAREAIEYLAARAEPLAHSGSGAAGDASAPGEGGSRKVSLGSIPDFAFAGPGYRLAGVVAASPADLAGLRSGDTIVKVDGRNIAGMRDFSNLLKTLEPGARIRIVFLRDGEEHTAEAELGAR